MSADATSRAAGLSPAKQALLERMLRGKGAGAPLERTIPRRGGSGPSPLSFAQARLWFIHQIDPSSAAYNLPSALRLRGPLDAEALERSLIEVVRRHESLRTRFEIVDGAPIQVIDPDPRVRLPLVDLSSLPEERREAEAGRIAREEAAGPFDLAHGPLVRARLARLGEIDHLFLLTMHHIVSDAWSMGVLVREIASLYEVFTAGRPSPLADLPIQYADFAAWQRDTLAGDRLARSLAYWRERLTPLPPKLELPADRPRPPVQTYRGGLQRVAIPARVADAIRRLAREEGATLFMALLAAFDALLSRLSGEEDVAIGTAIANRTLPELEPLIGFFVNALVLRVSCAGDPSFKELLARARETTLGAFEHQDLPFERIVEELHPERDLSRNPIFEVAFALQNAPTEEFDLPRLSISSAHSESGATRFDLEFHVWEAEGGGLEGFLLYSADLFDTSTVRRIAGRYATLLASIAEEPERRLSDLSLFEPGEREMLLDQWSGRSADYPRDATVVEIFEEVARERASEVALAFDGGSVTYGALSERMIEIARALRARGVRPESRVAIAIDRSPELIVTILGVLRAGGAYVPLDPDSPKARTARMLADASVSLVVTDGRAGLPEGAFEIVSFDALRGEAAGAEKAGGRSGDGSLPEHSRPHAGNLAYVMFTSGSTGEPKGIEVTHRNILRLVLGADYASFGPGQTILQLAPVAFDASTFEIWGALLTGGRLAIAPPGPASATEIARLLGRHQATTIWLTAGLFRIVVDEESAALARVAQVLAGGDVLSPSHVRRLLEVGCGRVVNGYGPTETTTFACCDVLAPGDEIGARVPIGRPIANSSAYLLDRVLRPVPIGAPGEICVGGDGVSRGYARRPDLTAERFVPDPYGPPGSRLYRTGDLARWRSDGRIEFLGRRDGQIKVRGFRVEVGEVEAALVSLPGVRAAAVVARGEAGSAELVGFLVPDGASQREPGALREALAALLPRPMIPSRFVFIEALPLTANGKIDRTALPEPGAPLTGGEGAAAPRTPTEIEVALVWAGVLGIEGIAASDNFFDLGGHSLLATQVVSRLRAALGVEVPLRALFEAPTVAALARYIDTRASSAGASRIPRAVRRGPIPLSFAQQRLWFLDRLAPGMSAYNIPSILRLRGHLDVTALRMALAEIVRRHEALRTRFVDGPASQKTATSGPEQVIDATAEMPVDLLDLSAEPDPEASARPITEAETFRPFDLARGPLLRARLLRLAVDDHVFLLTMHHIVSDGWSMSVLVREVAALYEAFSAGRPSPLPELPIQYADFSVWQRKTIAGDRLDDELDYWRRRLTPLPLPIELPSDRPRPPAQSFRSGRGIVSVSAKVAAAIRSLAEQNGATLFMALLAAFDALLARWTGETDIAIGTGIANRTFLELEPLIGFFVNTLVLRVDCSGDPTFRELLLRTRETALGAFAHQDLPFERLVEELHPARDLRRNPIFQVAFALQNTPASAFDLPGLSMGPFPFDAWTTRFDIELHLWEEGGGALGGSLFYSSDLFDELTARRLVDRYTTLLSSIAADPDRRLSTLRVAAGDELRTASLILARGADLPVEPRPVFTLFEEQAARSPAALALVEQGRLVTYGDLDSAAGRLAGRLRREGVGPGSRVVVIAPRSIDQVTAILAVSKAGGAYVPLDPVNPDPRLALMIERSGSGIVLAPKSHVSRVPPAPGRRVIPIDGEEGTRGAGGEIGRDLRLEDLAYAIFTSGSTGEPNLVEVTHANLANLVAWHRSAFGVSGSDRSTLVAGVGFDASVWEVWPYLASGACLLIPDESTRLDPKALRDWLVASGVTIAFLPTPLTEVLLALDWPGSCSLRAILTGGDRLHSVDPRRLPFRVINNYGPTEATVVSTSGDVDAGAWLDVPTIGRPIANARAYVLDARLDPVPIGVAGELFVGGAGVARGYTGRPDLTAERFLPDPYGEAPASRMYRTGDRARQLADGRLEFLGRTDSQVKIRGQRIEPGEVEAVLGRHPGVESAAVVAREDGGEKRLVAYVVPRRAAGDRAALEDEHLSRWRDLYDATYQRTPGEQDPSFNITGWNSSYTGEPIDAGEMLEWRESAVERILAFGPRRVLEIGCGTGLLLARIAPRCARYVATDFSRVSLDLVRRIIAGRDDLAHVVLHERMADDFHEIEPGSFDVVVLNSVVQYFPDASYLGRVLDGAMGAVAAGGHVFVGDVRDARLERAFAASVVLHNASPETPAREARARMERIVAGEEELLVSPAFFAAFAARQERPAWAEALVKRGRADNELTRFRYDGVLHAGVALGAGASLEIDWDERSRARLDEALRSGATEIVLRGIPNARLAADLAALRALEGAREGETAGGVRAVAGEPGALHPDEATARGGAAWTGTAGLSRDREDVFDIVLALAGAGGASTALALPAPSGGPGAPLTNQPLRVTIAGSLVPALREFAAALLPEAMVPSSFVVLEALPLTPNGKIDRRALSTLAGPRPAAKSTIAPRTPSERGVARVWAEVLGIERVGVTDNFFELGGHSLLAAQMISRLRAELGAEIPLRTIFDAPTVAALAAIVDAGARSSAPPDRILRVDRDRPIPLSFAQRRLWFLDRLEPANAAYNVAMALRLTGALDAAALGRALAEIERRHETLRTRFLSGTEGPLQLIDPPRSSVLDVEEMTSADPGGEALRLVAAGAGTPFDLERGPLWRARLLRVAPEVNVLSLVLHHIVTDGWSMDVLARELIALYGALAGGGESTLADPAIQYADWAAWQREWLEAGELDRQLEWWQRDLEGMEPLEIPTDRPRAARRGLRGASAGFEIEPEVAAGLARFARGEGATLFHVLLACFQATLARYAAADDVVVGTPVANRTLREAEPLIGFFANTLPIRTRVEGGMSLRRLVGRVREKTLDAYAHQDAPFEEIVDALHLPRDLSRNPLFDTMFVLQRAEAVAATGETAGGIAFEPISADTGSTPFDLTLAIAESQGRLLGSLQYDADLFLPATAGRFLERFSALARAVVGEPDALLGDVDLSSPEERALIDGTNETGERRPERCVHDLFDERVAIDGDSPAVASEKGDLSYAGLAALANRVARRLARAGVVPEAAVALLAARSPASMAGMLGIFKSGGVLVPLDASLPRDRLAAMVAGARVRAIVSEGGLEGALPHDGLPVVRLDAGDLPLDPSDPPETRARPANAAYVIFTSGSSGEPKRVLVEHRAIADRMLTSIDRYGLAPGDRVLHFLSPLFDAALDEILPTLASGATIVVHPDPRGETPAGFLDFCRSERVTVAHLTVGFLHELADDLDRTRGTLPASLRLIVTGGESPGGSRIAAILRAAPGRLTVTNAYGPTEATIDTTMHDISKEDEAADPVPIGRPIANTTVHLLDRRLRRVPPGAVGEIFIGGIGLARGYLGRPDETAAAFIPDNFSREPGARLYRTGDLGRRLADGGIVFIGRRDGQVKLRGFRVELGEIEAALLRVEGVREATVMVRGEGAGAILVAYVATAGRTGLDPARIRGTLHASLPDYMVPGAVVLLDAMPRTPTGKIDRRALPALERTGGTRARVAPRDDLERSVARIWGETLQSSEPGIDDNFFESGGNSLLAVRLVAAVRRGIGADLPVAAVFREPTIADLARLIRGGGRKISPLVTLREGRGLPPLVCVHEIAGGVSEFSLLAAHLDPGRPVLGLQALDAAPADSVEEAAAGYVEAIAREVPGGPIHLLGWSFGGLVAWEMALRLRAAGRVAGALVLLDTPAPDGRSPGGPALVRAASILWGIDVDQPDAATIVAAARASGAIPRDLGDAEAIVWLRGVAARLGAMEKYRPRPYDGDVVLVRATESHGDVPGHDALGWRGLVRGSLTVEWAPGSHYSVVRGEGARAVAAVVERHAARRPRGTSG